MKNFRIALLSLALLLSAQSISAQPVVEQINFPTAFAPDRSNALVYSSNGQTAFAASFKTDTLFSFDSTTGAQLDSISTGDGPGPVALCECGSRRVIAVANTAFISLPAPSVTFINATEPSNLSLISTARLKQKFSINGAANTLAFNADGTAAFVSAITASGRSTLFSLEVATGNILDMLNFDAPIVSAIRAGISGNERLVLTSNGSQRPEVIIIDIKNTRSLKVAARLILPANSGFSNENNAVASSDGSFAYLASADAGLVFAIDLVNARIAADARAGNFPAQIDLIENGEKRLLAAVAIFDGAVNIFDASRPESLNRISSFRSQSPFLTTAPALSADGRRGFVATEFGNRLYTFDTTTGEQLDAQDLGAPPANLKLSRAAGRERLGLVDTINNRALLFELDELDQLPKPTGNFSPRDGVNFSLTQNILLSRDGRRAFVASPTSNELLIIDPENRMVKQRVKVGRGPERIALAETGGLVRLAVANVNSASISLVQIGESEALVTGTVELPRANPTELSLLAISLSSDASVGFVSDGVSRLLKFDAISGEILDSLEVGPEPLGLALFEQNNERRLAIISIPTDGPSSVVIVEATGKLREVARYRASTSQKFALNNLPVFSSDGRTIFIVSSFSLELLSIDSGTGELISRLKGINAAQPTLFKSQGRDRLIAVNVGATRFPIVEVDPEGRLKVKAHLKRPKGQLFIVSNNAAVNQDATRAYVANYSSGELVVFEPASGTIIQTLALGNGPGNLVLSSDGRRLIIIETNGTASRIDIIKLS